jgi:hypothetical protein
MPAEAPGNETDVHMNKRILEPLGASGASSGAEDRAIGGVTGAIAGAPAMAARQGRHANLPGAVRLRAGRPTTWQAANTPCGR